MKFSYIFTCFYGQIQNHTQSQLRSSCLDKTSFFHRFHFLDIALSFCLVNNEQKAVHRTSADYLFCSCDTYPEKTSARQQCLNNKTEIKMSSVRQTRLSLLLLPLSLYQQNRQGGAMKCGKKESFDLYYAYLCTLL